MELLGNESCQPIGDCSAPFPPAGAAVFVDANFTAAQLDSTHFRTLGPALAAATSAAVIAVERGTYRETNLRFNRAVTLTGRCAGEVIVESPGADQWGLWVQATKGVRVGGLTLRGHSGGAYVLGGGTLELADVVVEASRDFGAVAMGSGTQLTLSHAAVRNTQSALANAGVGVFAGEGASVRISDSVIRANRYAGVMGGAPGTQVALARTLVSETRAGINPSAFGVAIEDNARLTLEDCLLADNEDAALVVQASALATASRIEVRGTRRHPGGNGGTGILVQSGAQLIVVQAALVGNRGFGAGAKGSDSRASLAELVVRRTRPDDGEAGAGAALVALGGSRLEVRSAALIDNSDLGLFAASLAEASLTESLVRDPRQLPGAAAFGVVTQSGGRATLSASAVIGHDVEVLTQEPGSTVSLVRFLTRGALRPGGRGIGVIALDQASALLTGGVIDETELALAFVGGSGKLMSGYVARNSVALYAEQGSQLRVVSSDPQVVAPGEVLVDERTAFVDNTVRVGSGSIPLPKPPTVSGF